MSWVVCKTLFGWKLREVCSLCEYRSKSNDEFEVDRTLDRNVLIFNFILIESKLSWSNCDLVHWTEGKDGPKLILNSFEERRSSEHRQSNQRKNFWNACSVAGNRPSNVCTLYPVINLLQAIAKNILKVLMISIQYMQIMNEQSMKEQTECHGFQNAYFVLKWVIPRFILAFIPLHIGRNFLP